MKRVFAGLAAAFVATAAMAQQVTPVEPAPSSGSIPPPPSGQMGSPGTEVATLTMRDGKWWNGDREATPAEVEAYKKAKEEGRPK